MSSTSYLKALYKFFKKNEENELTITVWTPDADRDANIIAQFHQTSENSYFDEKKKNTVRNLKPNDIDKILEQELLKQYLKDYPDLKFDLKEGNKPIWFDGNMKNFIEENIKPDIEREELKKLIIEQLELQKGMIGNLTIEQKNEKEKHNPTSYKYLNNELNQEEENNYVNNEVEKVIECMLPSFIQSYQRIIDDEIKKGKSTKGFFISLNINDPFKYTFYCPETIKHVKESYDKDNINLLFFINSTDYRFEITSENGDSFKTEDFLDNLSTIGDIDENNIVSELI